MAATNNNKQQQKQHCRRRLLPLAKILAKHLLLTTRAWALTEANEDGGRWREADPHIALELATETAKQ